MDPTKFTNGSPRDNEKMTIADLETLIPIWREFADASVPGLIALFSYSMRRTEREYFVASVVDRVLQALPALSLGVLEVLNYTSDYHVAMLLSADHTLLTQLRRAVVRALGHRSRACDVFPIDSNVYEATGP